jgi:hypothetical protein
MVKIINSTLPARYYSIISELFNFKTFCSFVYSTEFEVFGISNQLTLLLFSKVNLLLSWYCAITISFSKALTFSR